MRKKIFIPQSLFFFYFLWSTILFFSISPSDATESVTLQLKWKHQFQFAGYYAAIEKGYYKQENIDVTLIEGKPGGNEIAEVISGRANFGVGMADILLARLKGEPVVILASIFQHSPTVFLTIKGSGFSSPHDLFAQKIMMTPGYKSTELQAMLANEGIPLDKVTILKPSWKLDDLIDGKVAAMAAYISSAPYFLKKKNIPYTIISPTSYGIDFYGDNLFTSEQEINQYPNRVRAFRKASLKGWQYALDHPEEIIDIILLKYTSDRKDLTKEFLVNEASSYQKLILPKFVKIGHMNPGRWKHIADTYVKLGMTDKDYSLEGLLYDSTPAKFDWGHWAVKLGIGIIIAGFASTLFLLFFNRRLNREIYDRKKAEGTLRESEERFRALFENAPLGYQSLDANGDLIEINETWCKLLGYTKAEVFGKNFSEFLHPDFKEVFKENFPKFKKVGYILGIEFEMIKKDGTEIIVAFDGRIGYENDGSFKQTHCVLSDVSERKLSEDALRASEKKYRHLFNNAPAGIYEIDFEKVRFINVNEVMCKYSGYSEKEFLALNPLDLLTEESKNLYIERFEKLSTKENLSLNVEYNIIKKNGQELCVTLNSDYIYKNGKLTGARVVASDITELKQAQEEKIKAQKIAGEQKKLALVGQVAGKMAHDFNNILGIIMGNTELSLMDCKDAEMKKTLELIFEQTIRGKNLTRNLVAFAKDQEPKQEFFRISEKIDLVVNLLKKDLQGIELIKEDKSGVPDLLADSGMIEHALINLVQNSIHAVSMSEYPKIIIKTYCLNDKICFEIEDNGCGIPKENLKNIYDPSFTLKGTKDITGSYGRGIKGTGYGMANVKKYIEQHKGNISVESEFNSGTKFTISLPVIKKELTSEEKVEIQKEKICFNKSILLVEDEPAISGVQYRILSQEPCNHKVDIANDGQVAMDLFNRNQYDFISLDYVLPGKINGMDVYNHIRTTDKTIPILFISGNIEFLESIKKLKQKDANIDHLSKPCQNKDYITGINKLLARTLVKQE